MSSEPRGQLYRLPFFLFLLLAGIYLLTTGGHTYASDEEQMFAVSEALATRGSFAIGVDAAGAPLYSNYGPGQPLLALPLYALGRFAAGGFPPEGGAYVTRALVSWFNPLVTAATGGLLALAALRLGYGRRTAVGVALIYGLATLAWPHSKTFFAEPLAAAFTFGSFVAALGGEPAARDDRRWLARLGVSGMLAGLACAVKLQAGLALPALGLWVLWHAGASARPGAPALRRAMTAGLAWGLGVALAFGALGAYQWALFGSPLRSGYGSVGGVGGLLTTPLADGLYGLILSPGKGVIWYAPPLVLLPWALVLLWRRDRGAAALCAALTLVTLTFYAMVLFWHGDGAWGPRYLNMALPFMVFPLVALIEAGRLARVALALTLLLAAPVQLGGVLVNLNAYLGVQRAAERRYYEPAQSPIVGHLRLLGQQLATTYALRLAPGTLALVDGFSYSEGDRAAGDQLPRWSLPEARLLLRPPAGQGGVRVDLALSGCRPAPIPPAVVTLGLDMHDLGAIVACPPRRVALLLPPVPAELRLETSGWRPADVGIDREGELGVYLTGAAARVGAQPLALAGRAVPIPPMPAGHVALRQWTSDYRYGHWDLWAWYLAHSGLPARPAWALALAWLFLGLGLFAVGLVGVTYEARGGPRPARATRRSRPYGSGHCK